MNESAPRTAHLSDAMAEIAMLEQQTRQEGSVDSETDAFNAIRTELQTGKLKPNEAMEKARGVSAGRQNYH